MADLSQQLRDYRLTKRKEKLATVGRIAGGILDIPLQGGVSGSVRRWSPPKDKPLTIREQLGAELKLAEKSQARSARNKASIEMHAKRANALAEQMESLKPGTPQLDKTQQHALQELRREQAQYQGSKNEFPTDYLTKVVDKLAKYDGRVAVHIMNEISPELVRSVLGEADKNYGTGRDIAAFKQMIADHNQTNDERAAQLELVRADYNKATADLQAAEAGEIRHGDGISGVDTGVDFSKSPPSSSQYSAAGPQSISRIQELYDKVPDNRKDSQKQHAALAADPKMRELAEDLGLNPDNSIQMDHFIKTMTKAEKKARRLYAKARRKGWTDQELAAELKKSSLYSDPEGLSNKHMLVEMQLSLLGVKQPKALATTLTPEEIEDVEEELTSEYEEEFDTRKDAEDLAVRGATEDQAAESVAGRTAEEQAEVDADIVGQEEENLQTQQDLAEGFNPDDFSFNTDEAALGFKTAPGLEDAEDSYEWQGVPEEDLAPRVPHSPPVSFGETRLGDRLGMTLSNKQKTDVALAEAEAKDKQEQEKRKKLLPNFVPMPTVPDQGY